MLRFGYEIQAHSKEQQNVTLRELLIAQPTQGLIIQCSDYTSSRFPPSPSLISLLLPTFQAFYYSFARWSEIANGGEGRISSHFCPLDVGKPSWG